MMYVISTWDFLPFIRRMVALSRDMLLDSQLGIKEGLTFSLSLGKIPLPNDKTPTPVLNP
jgi:hypothetical protein